MRRKWTSKSCSLPMMPSAFWQRESTFHTVSSSIYVDIRYVHPDVDIGIVLGTGTNAAIVKEPEDMPKWKPAVLSKKRYQAVVNIEWGGYHSESLPINEFDKALLTEKDQPGPF